MATLTIADLDNGKRDLQTIDQVANSRAATATTRFGQQTTTLYESIRRINAAGDEILSNLGFRVPVPYASGLNVTDSRFTVTGPDGKVYAPLSAPFTTGAWDPSQWYVLQNDLNDKKLLVFETLAAAQTAAATLPDGQPIHVIETSSLYEVDAGALKFLKVSQDVVNLKDFGAKGGYTPDDTAAVERAFSELAGTGKTLFLNDVFRVTKSLRLPRGIKLWGPGKPNFNITVGSDDKRLLRPGFKHLLPGACIIWSGSQTDTITTGRTDRFSSFGYMLATEYFEPGQIEGVGLICDVDCYDAAGNLTTYENDNRANYDVGFVVDNGMDGKFHKMAVFGYFAKKKAIVVVVRNTDTSNPDYNFFFDVTAFGGVALIGYESSPNQGLSGTLFNGCSLYDQTYHNRSTTKADDYIDQDVIYIDGLTGTTNAINGHKFIGGCIRSTCPVPIKLNRAKDLAIIGVTTECTLNSKYAGQTLQYITGTVNTDRVTFQGNRTASWGIRLRAFANEIGGTLIIDEDWAGKAFLTKAGKGISWGAPDQISNDPAIQLSNDFSSFTKGWNLRYSISAGVLQFNFDGANRGSLNVTTGDLTISGRLQKIPGSGVRANRTIIAGAITAVDTSQSWAIAGEGGAADDLDNITGGLAGDVVYLELFSVSQPITVKKNTNLRLNSDFAMTSINSVLVLQKTASGFWREIARSVNV